MSRLKSCSICGKIHSGECPKKKDTHRNTKERQFRRSSEWRKCREKILERDKYCCQICLAKGIINSSKSLHVHHIRPLYSNWELRTDPSNLLSLCEDCHMKCHGNEYNIVDILKLIPSND